MITRPQEVAPAPGRSGAWRFGAGDGAVAFLMILPAAILFCLFYLWPFINGFWLSLHNWDGFSDPTWAGFSNYQRLLHDRIFLGALRNNLIFVVAVVILKNVLGLGLALLLNRALVGRAFFRAAAFVPVTMSFVAVGLLWSWIYNPVFGLLNGALDLFGLGALKQSWLGDADIALYSIIVVDVWKWLGFHAVIYLAGLQTIPSELYESAKMDGAGPLQRFRHVTVPMMMPIVFINTILGLSGAFVRNFDIVYVLTKGGPNHATEVVLTYMMSKAFQDGAMSYAAAIGYVLFLIVGLASVGLLALMRRQRLDV
ncbi:MULTISPECIES: sugar ABC transporter permease [Mesorhizobium]|uniref:Binding-protein-dependent transport systems inner membrane component n=1 Tax=Mesorhizobium opportunistum (strain LMG 24607 / HAMBI 3007 / WSM2075) TaxID=536019 RepID=F7YHJ1_MESOW|nr:MULTISPECIES: sugar ABC transporter permease [Mesorhizobium]AEH90364.1 binding-protein-dependent transport systems inner membrane component [Mesorhizobium opportunistum WSM2075]MCA0030116.1 sugar ABC transporter permease [Mesorhizobium sp. B263B2A]TPN50749.1 sugar ABC transporter permease [Mesorhizobium sp. B1-1-7]